MSEERIVHRQECYSGDTIPADSEIINTKVATKGTNHLVIWYVVPVGGADE